MLQGKYMDSQPFHQARMALLQQLGISVFVDGGANTGEYASHIRQSGFSGRIISFEPSSAAYAKLSNLAAHDSLWHCYQVALGEVEKNANFYLSANKMSHSLLPMKKQHTKSAPNSKYVATEVVKVMRLDSICSEFITKHDAVYVKLDLQGYEKYAIKGAADILHTVKVIEIELAMKPLYVGQMLYSDMIHWLDALGFHLHAYAHNFVDINTNEVLDINGIFIKRGV